MKKRLSLSLVFSLMLAVMLVGCGAPEPEPVPEPDGGSVEAPPGSDWRTWRAYTQDYEISADITVCFSSLDTGEGLAVYDAAGGARIGNLIFADGGEYTLADAADLSTIMLEDLDEDGDCEVGILMLDDAVIWYQYDAAAAPWPDNPGGVFAYLQTDAAGRAISAPVAEIDALTAALGDRTEGKMVVDYGEVDVNGVACRQLVLGTDTPEKFTAEEHYAVSPAGEIYYMDAVQGAEWLPFVP